MTNGRGETLRHYHDATKHSYDSIRMTPHFLDWDNQPLPFKLYENVEQVALPDPTAPMEEISSTGVGIGELTRVLHYSAGVTKRRRIPGGEMLFRAASCTGALYHIEIYVVAGPLEGLDAGVYHYGPKDSVLSRLRRGDFRRALVDASGDEPSLREAPLALVLTSTFWRNAWKYRARAYRHTFWDGGTMYSHVEAMAAYLRLPVHLVYGFADDDVNRLLDLDDDKEVSVAIAALGDGASVPDELPEEIRPLELETVPLSRSEVDYPLIREAHESSSLASGREAHTWRGSEIAPRPEPPAIPEVEAVIRRRGSSRRFERTEIERDAALEVLESTLPAIDADVPPIGEVYVLVNAVGGLSPGAYYYPRHQNQRRQDEPGTLHLLKEGEFREEARYLDLEQDLGGDASVNVYVLASLGEVFERYGDRGYRAAQFEGGVLGGRMYLASYARGLGATGLTFYDDAVTDFFSPHAAGKSVMFLLAFGVPAKSRVLFQR